MSEQNEKQHNTPPLDIAEDSQVNSVFDLVNQYSKDNDCDIIIYYGDILYGQDNFIIEECRRRKLRKNVLLLLSTRGGDPNAGYRIARCLQEAYKTLRENKYFGRNTAVAEHGTFTVFVDNVCQSAGTLICIGADKILMSGSGQLGPIDIQLMKRDEIGERESGLAPMQAIRLLEMHAGTLFMRNFINLRFSRDVNFSTRMAKDVATKLTVGLLEPVYSQLDPTRLAEVDRSMRVASEYAERLNNGNLKDGALDQLVAGYPSHGFVIDRGETRTIFKNVEKPCTVLREIADYFYEISKTYPSSRNSSDPMVQFLTPEP